MDLNVESEVKRIVEFIKEIVQESKTKGIMIGLSGGIDSALTATLSVRAIRKEKVLALIMPIHSNQDDVEDATLVANFLELEYKILYLSDVFERFLDVLSLDHKPPKELAKANLKPRMRMCALYYYANHLNYLVAGTGNKSEDDIGYFTKYGDGGVDFHPIRHLYKHEVREMARFLKVPETIITRKPSAGLWEGQTDEGELSQQLGFAITYDYLDEMLENIEQKNFDPKDEKYKKLVELKKKNQHKIELPPVLKRR